MSGGVSGGVNDDPREPGREERPVLFSSVRSPHCFKVSIALHEKEIRFLRVEIDLPAKEQKTAAFLAIQPRGQVPAFRDAAGTWIDSLDILLHLDEVRPTPRLFPGDPAVRDETLAWIERSSTVQRDVSHHLYHQLLEPPEGGADPDEVARLRTEALAELDLLERTLARSSTPGLIEASDLDGRSAADVCVYAWTSGFRRFFAADALRPFERVRAWWAAWDQRDAVRASRGATGVPFDAWLREQQHRT
ncbi:MAG: glutathione S-transferase family protein [Trueperaceae bacterium]